MSPQEIIRVQHDRGYMKLRLPIFFENALLDDIRKVLKLIKKHSCRNEDTYERLDRFLPLWAQDVKDHLVAQTAFLETAELKAQEAPCYNHRGARRNLKFAVEAVKPAKALLKRCEKVIAAYKAIKL